MGEKSLLASYQAACFLLGFGVLPVLVHLAYRRRSPTLGDLLALTGLLAVAAGVVLLVADAWLSGQMERFWSGTIAFAVVAVLYAAVVIWQPSTSPERPRPGR